jgi:2-oxoglutarate dehydrogenase E2 component (dihydrolipoamide succinyltransferase)
MTTEIRVPTLGESVTEATVAKWFKKVGDAVAQDEALCELETDKVALEVNAPAAGRLARIDVEAGATVGVGAILGAIEEGAAGAVSAPRPAATSQPAAPQPAAPRPAAPPPPPSSPQAAPPPSIAPAGVATAPLAPSVRKIVEENRLDPAAIAGTGRDGRLTKADALGAVAQAQAPASTPAPAPAQPSGPRAKADREERVRMTRLRKRIAERLKQAQNTAAMLTTFNEVDMTNLMAARARYKDVFEKKHGSKLGFMSFFVKACVTALKEIPQVNGEIDGDDIVYKNYYDIGVAVGTPQGLVVPVVRDCDVKGFADIEKEIEQLGRKARDGKLSLDELQGGTFTISNGGVYGSLMSTPIINPPQSAILGMHKIQDRPMAIGKEIQIRPMMYLALSYDHRLIDGREAVTFLVRVKECLEDPQRILLDL